MNIQNIRKDFPILKQEIYGKPLIYLDNAATTQKPVSVIEAMNDLYFRLNSNIHRGVHYLSEESTSAHENARKYIADFIHAKHTHEIIFTRGTTEAVNLVAFSFGEKNIQQGDEILVTEMEHHSNFVPWKMLAERKSAKLIVLPFEEDGSLSLEKFQSAITEKTKIISITHVSNVLGTINPVKEMIRIAHEADVPVFVDAAQSIQHLSVDVQDLDCDFLAFSGHKIYGPTGIGVLYGKEKLLDEMPPYQGGGEMISSVSLDKITYNELPFKFEAGTPNYVAAIGLQAAIKYLEDIGMQDVIKYEHDLFAYATEQLLQIEGLKMIGTAKKKTSVLSFVMDGIHPYDMGTMLDKTGIAVRSGTHCAEPVMQHYGISGTIRASVALYNTKAEIDKLVENLNKIQMILS
ncbi:MAG: cysteine desulfurase [Bacteroidales bacterium]|jgi:cysteine desulfurase/selenocysteine lyase|nr:cysteine desulfurase [Bacteroidales bacterium]